MNQEQSLSDEDFIKIQTEYRRQKVRENLVGPCISTAVHVIVFLCLFMFAVGTISKKNAISVELSPMIDQPLPPRTEPILEDTDPKPPTPDENLDTSEPNLNAADIPTPDDISLEDINEDPPSTDDLSQESNINDIKPNAATSVASIPLGNQRSGYNINKMSQIYSNKKSSNDALMRALFWLQKVQSPNGSWGKKHVDGFTGLALLVYLAHGELPKSKNFGSTVSKAIQYLATSPISKQASNGYSHAIKTYALAEAYSMTGNYNLIEVLENNAAILIENQLANGSYSYKYEKASARYDMSIAGWNFQALNALSHSNLPIQGLNQAIEKSILRLKQQSTHGFPYGPNAKGGKHSLLGVGTLCLQLFNSAKGFKPTDQIMDTLKIDALAKLNWDSAPKNALYSWYYSTYAMFQHGGKHWKTWNNKFQDLISKNQNPEGSWNYPGDFHGHSGDDITDKVHATVFSCLMLEVFYRYAPSNLRTASAHNSSKKLEHESDEDLDIFGDVKIL